MKQLTVFVLVFGIAVGFSLDQVQYVEGNDGQVIKLFPLKIASSIESLSAEGRSVLFVEPMAQVDVQSLQKTKLQCFDTSSAMQAKNNVSSSAAIIPIRVKLWDKDYLNRLEQLAATELKRQSAAKNKTVKQGQEGVQVLALPAKSLEVMATLYNFPFFQLRTSLQQGNTLPSFSDFSPQLLEFALYITSDKMNALQLCSVLRAGQSDTERARLSSQFITNWFLNNIKMRYSLPRTWFTEQVLAQLESGDVSAFQSGNVTLDFEELSLPELITSTPWHHYVSTSIKIHFLSVDYLNTWISELVRKLVHQGVCRDRACHLSTAQRTAVADRLRSALCRSKSRLTYTMARRYYKSTFPNTYASLRTHVYCRMETPRLVLRRLQRLNFPVPAVELLWRSAESRRLVTFTFPLRL